jgi:hypothetical protein
VHALELLMFLSTSTAPAGAHSHCLAFANACAGRRQADVHDVHVEMIVRPADSSSDPCLTAAVVRLADRVLQIVRLFTGTHG